MTNSTLSGVELLIGDFHDAKVFLSFVMEESYLHYEKSNFPVIFSVYTFSSLPNGF